MCLKFRCNIRMTDRFAKSGSPCHEEVSLKVDAQPLDFKEVMFRLGLLSAIGLILQFFPAVPYWLRWHLASFGFVFITTYGLMYQFKWSWWVSLLISMLISVGFELYQFSYGRGDWIDMYVYAFACVISLICRYMFRS